MVGAKGLTDATVWRAGKGKKREKKRGITRRAGKKGAKLEHGDKRGENAMIDGAGRTREQ